jgi:hypothetical protein
MNKDRWLIALLGSYLLAALALCGHIETVRGQEAAPPLPPEGVACRASCQEVAAIERAAQTLLAELGPGFAFHVSKLPDFDLASGACGSKTACEEMIARLNVDFDAPCAGAACAAGTCTERPAKFVSLGCACAAAGECHCAGEGACKCCPCGGEATHVSEVTCGSECNCTAEHSAAFASHEEQNGEHHKKLLLHVKSSEQCPFVEHMTRLVAEHAAARAELASRKEASEKFSEVYESMAELIAANAALHARLEAQQEQLAMTEKLAHLAAENARLKAHVELAGHSEAGQHALTLTLENERLKQRIVALEQKQAEAPATRTAAKARSERKAR